MESSRSFPLSLKSLTGASVTERSQQRIQPFTADLDRQTPSSCQGASSERQECRRREGRGGRVRSTANPEPETASGAWDAHRRPTGAMGRTLIEPAPQATTSYGGFAGRLLNSFWGPQPDEGSAEQHTPVPDDDGDCDGSAVASDVPSAREHIASEPWPPSLETECVALPCNDTHTIPQSLWAMSSAYHYEIR